MSSSWLSSILALPRGWGSCGARGADDYGIICCSRPATAQLLVRQRGVASELSAAIPAAISASESLERATSAHLPTGDSLSTTLSSPQFSQALSMFWSALQSGQAAPVVRQFGLGPEAVTAAAAGNIEQFVGALETEAKSGTAEAGKEEPSPPPPPAVPAPTSASAPAPAPAPADEKSEEKSKTATQPLGSDSAKGNDDDDDEGMALD